MSYVPLGARTPVMFKRRGGTPTIQSQAEAAAMQTAERFVAGRGLPPELVNAVKALQPMLLLVKSNRKFFSRLIVQWIKDDRGLPGVIGYEKGRAHGGGFVTNVAGRSVNLQYAYNILRKASKESDPQYDNLRATALTVILVRDAAHVANSAAKLFRKGLGNPNPEQAAEQAAEGDVEKIDYVALATAVSGIFQSIMSVLDQLLAGAADIQPTGAGAGAGSGSGSGSDYGKGSEEESSKLPILPIAIGVAALALILKNR